MSVTLLIWGSEGRLPEGEWVSVLWQGFCEDGSEAMHSIPKFIEEHADVRYCSDDYIKRLTEFEMRILMGVGNVYKDLYAESLNKILKKMEQNY